MNLKSRILLAYGYLVILVVLGAVSAALGFRDLGASIESVLGENFESVQASISMLESLERQDSAVLGVLLGEQQARLDLEQAEEVFVSSLERARSNVTIAGETVLIDALAKEFDAYRRNRMALVELAPEQPLRAYETSTYPAFVRVKDLILELVELNHEAMQQEDIAVQRSAATRAALHGMLVAVAVLSLAPLVRSIRVNVLDRIHELAEVASSIAAGDRRRRASVHASDELGVVARQFNAVLDQLSRAEAEAAGETDRDRRFLRALLARVERPAALARRDGRLVASTLDPALLPQLADLLQDRSGADAPAEETVEIDDHHLRLEPLSEGRRLLGFLIVERGPASGHRFESRADANPGTAGQRDG